MALLGMGANMQYNGNFPGYCSRINLNMEANSSTWPINNMDKMFDCGPFYNGVLSSFPLDPVLGYHKEELKQMMLKHETIFRDQVSFISTFGVNRNRNNHRYHFSDFNKTIVR